MYSLSAVQVSLAVMFALTNTEPAMAGTPAARENLAIFTHAIETRETSLIRAAGQRWRVLADSLSADRSNGAVRIMAIPMDETLPREPITVREQGILKLIAEGNCSREIADLLGISRRTIYRKIDHFKITGAG